MASSLARAAAGPRPPPPVPPTAHGRRTGGLRGLSTGPGGSLTLLDHVHLTGPRGSGIVDYGSADALQEQHRTRFLDWKAGRQGHGEAAAPRAKLISFESQPVFTLGRRQGGLAEDQVARLQRPLLVRLPHRADPLHGAFKPEVRKTSRGGLTTYHGPGQLVLWPVLDMHSAAHARYSVATYASHLEATTRRLLADLFGIRTYVSRDEPGVWVGAGAEERRRKIAALGVHHRRYVTALGIALNVDVPVVGCEDVNPWARFVPCGLEGRLVTSVAAETGGGSRWSMAELAQAWARRFDEGLCDERLRAAPGDGGDGGR